MAIVRSEYTRWQGSTGSPQDVGYLLVWANDSGQRLIDRVEIDNTQCSDTVWVHVVDDDGVTVMFSEVVAPGGLLVDRRAQGTRWNRNTQQRVSQWFVSVATSKVG